MSDPDRVRGATQLLQEPAVGSSPAPLGAEETTRLGDFARACKAAARAVVLYPSAHPAIATTLARLVDLTSAAHGMREFKITVLPDSLLLDGRAPARTDPGVAELAAILHEHMVGEITIHPDGDIEAWRGFLLMLARTPESVRADGGIARLWMTMGMRHVELREIDYAEVLRERSVGQTAVWERVIANCLQGDTFDFDDDSIPALVELVGDPQQLAELVTALDARAAAGGGVSTRTAALFRLLRGIADTVAKTDPGQVEIVLRNMASAVGRLSPEMMLELLSHRPGLEPENAEAPRLVGEVVQRMSDQTIARFVTRSVARDGTATDRLAQAFQALVTDHDRRHQLLGLAHDEALETPLGQTEGFESLWGNVRDLLTSYSDSTFVPQSYARELSGARTQAIEVDRVSDDPPDRMAAWRSTVAPSAVRALDLTLLLDLLRIEDDPASWRDLMRPVVKQIEDLLLVGDFNAAQQLVAVVAGASGPGGAAARRPAAAAAIEQLAGGAMMRHIVSHLATVDEGPFEEVKSICLAIGDVVVRPLAEALSVEARGRTRERLTALLMAFGATGRQAVERLKSSQNPAVRRTAIYLLREFGGSEALPDLTSLLADTEQQVQREAIRAILNIGTDDAYHVLQEALTRGTPQSREAIMQAIGLVREARATPLFAYILGHVDHRGPLRPIYLRAIESLGALRDPDAVEPLKGALQRGEWWAPRRTAELRGAAAYALARIGTPAALEVLQQAANSSSRGVRTAARPALKRATQSERRT